jgi:CRP/FNR family transcriptional regulator, cyclic AMP receptor protein
MFKFFSRSRQKPDHRAVDSSGLSVLKGSDVTLLTEFFCNTTSVIPMSRQEASIAASYLRVRKYATDEVIIRAGDKINTDYMLWILEGEASIEASAASAGIPIFMTVLGAGNTLGEMGLMDGEVRSVNCVASAPTRGALLSKSMLQNLCIDHPAVAAKLMSIVCMGISVRLRDITEKFKRYVQLNRALSDELNELSPLVPID